jgi:hypothetical protein
MALSAAAATANAAQVRHCCWFCAGATICTALLLLLLLLLLLYACGDVASMSCPYKVASSVDAAAHRLPLLPLVQAAFGLCL